jgi:undecaprenyl-diphosphatase
MQEYLENIDRALFLGINNAHSVFFDWLIPYATQFHIWTPLFAVAIYFLYKKYQKKLALILVCFALLIGITDPVANLVKKSVKRVRPTHNIEIADHVKTVDGYRGGEFGFVSGHAANSFGIAVLLFLLFKGAKLWVKLIFIDWAIFICYTRIYLGVHYPADLIGGAIIGIATAFIVYRLYLFLEKKLYKEITFSYEN